MSKKPLPTGENIQSWSPDQVARFKQLQSDPTVWLGYWFSDKEGQPTIGARNLSPARLGVVHKADRAVLCFTGLHATRHLLRWGKSGRRCWIVALSGSLQVGDNKACGTRREILGEILPEDRGENWRLRIASGENDFRGQDLRGAELRRPCLGDFGSKELNFQGADLSGANLRDGWFYKTNLQGADLTGANLSNANLTEADLTGANLSGANLRGAILTRAKLWRANLTGADLSGAIIWRGDFRVADMSGANLTRADLSGAILTGADLTGANLYGANLRVADLFGANLYGADLTGAIRG